MRRELDIKNKYDRYLNLLQGYKIEMRQLTSAQLSSYDFNEAFTALVNKMQPLSVELSVMEDILRL